MKHRTLALGSIAVSMLALTTMPNPTHAQENLYVLGEASFATIEPGLDADKAILEGSGAIDEDGYRATLGLGYSTTIPLLGVFAGAEAAVSRSFIETETTVNYNDMEIAQALEAAMLTDDDNEAIADYAEYYSIAEEWRFVVSTDVGMRLLPGLIVFARVSYVDAIVDVERIDTDVLIENALEEQVPAECDDECVRAIRQQISEDDNDAKPDEDDLSGEEFGVGVLYQFPLLPLSIRGIITIEPETAFSAGLLFHF